MNKYFYYTYAVFQNDNTCLHGSHSADTYIQGRCLSVLQTFSHKMRSYNTFARENCVGSKIRLLFTLQLT